MHRINLTLHLRTGTTPIAVRPERRGPFRSEVEFAQPAFTENVAPYIVRRVFCAPCLILSFSLSRNAKQTPLNLLWPRYRKETMLFKVLYLLSLLLFDGVVARGKNGATVQPSIIWNMQDILPEAVLEDLREHYYAGVMAAEIGFDHNAADEDSVTAKAPRVGTQAGRRAVEARRFQGSRINL